MVSRGRYFISICVSSNREIFPFLFYFLVKMIVETKIKDFIPPLNLVIVIFELLVYINQEKFRKF